MLLKTQKQTLRLNEAFVIVPIYGFKNEVVGLASLLATQDLGFGHSAY